MKLFVFTIQTNTAWRSYVGSRSLKHSCLIEISTFCSISSKPSRDWIMARISKHCKSCDRSMDCLLCNSSMRLQCSSHLLRLVTTKWSHSTTSSTSDCPRSSIWNSFYSGFVSRSWLALYSANPSSINPYSSLLAFWEARNHHFYSIHGFNWTNLPT